MKAFVLLYLHRAEKLITKTILSHETLKKLFTVQKQFFHSFHGCPAFFSGAFFCTGPAIYACTITELKNTIGRSLTCQAKPSRSATSQINIQTFNLF